MGAHRERLPKGVTARETYGTHTIRYRLANGWFIDKCRHSSMPWRYAIYIPGGHPSGGAVCAGGANKLVDAIDQAFDMKPVED